MVMGSGEGEGNDIRNEYTETSTILLVLFFKLSGECMEVHYVFLYTFV